ncbi:MAG TPA: RsmE family RNA methyltransferase [Synergistales bacterium]|nr:RsmE family RNA methyltransferase [Synergistales bacterium]HPC75423.1 RsmE family RNA methyltransferase [Synergistales bacterium]HRS48140.1 RsmE family RNA methyltransferase [Thermovirgaceae bacterium]HRU90666.1 RsmE family RNA methyltransferase [Thermovirgaceae bacterium]
MSLPRVRLESSVPEGDSAWILDPQESHHLVTVRRCREGDLFEGLLPGRKLLMRLELAPGLSRGVVLRETPESPKGNVWLLAALLKGEAFDRMLAQVVEAGVSVIVPLSCSRSVVSLVPERIPTRMKRWERIVLESTKQCGRAHSPEILEPMLVSSVPSLGLPSQRFITVTGPAPSALVSKVQEEAAVAVGPEGDWTKEELEILERNGFQRISLGPNLMRSPTASVVAVAVLAMMMAGRSDD